MTRERIPPGPVLQRAYGVLDKYQMSRTFFIKTDQKGCDPELPAFEAYDPTEPTPVAGSTATASKKKKKNPTAEKTNDPENELVTSEKQIDQQPIDANNLSSVVDNISNNSTVL